MTAPCIRIHGARGSLPAPGSAFDGAGGNTTCVEIRTPGGRLVLDAGSGIRNLATDPAEDSLDLILTHFHWDHIIGLPWLPAMHRPGTHVRIHAPCPDGSRLEDVLGGRLAPVYFPLPATGFAARVTLHALEEGTHDIGGCEITAARVEHPSRTFGYRVQCAGRVIAFAPDSELGNGHTDAVMSLATDADVLIHDAMYSAAEYGSRRGWGHSTPAQAARLALDAGARRLLLFHHDPARTDAALPALLDEARTVLRSGDVDVQLAREGDRISL